MIQLNETLFNPSIPIRGHVSHREMVVVGHHSPGEGLEVVSLLCCGKLGLESVRLALVTEDVPTARHPVVHVVDPSLDEDPLPTRNGKRLLRAHLRAGLVPTRIWDQRPS